VRLVEDAIAAADHICFTSLDGKARFIRRQRNL